MSAPAARDLAPFIQHTLIEAGVTRERIVEHAREAVRYGFNAAMVPGSWVDVVADPHDALTVGRVAVGAAARSTLEAEPVGVGERGEVVPEVLRRGAVQGFGGDVG